MPPGHNIVQASRGRRNASTEGEFGALPVSVDGVDVTNLVLQMSAGSSIAGRITFDTSNRTKTPSRAASRLSPIPVDFDQTPQNAFASAEITTTGRSAGFADTRRLQLLRVPAGWALKEIRVNGIDATDRPLVFGRPNQSLRDVEVVLTDRVSELAGTIADDRGSAISGARLMVFATDRQHWYPASRFMRVTTTKRPTVSFRLPACRSAATTRRRLRRRQPATTTAGRIRSCWSRWSSARRASPCAMARSNCSTSGCPRARSVFQRLHPLTEARRHERHEHFSS